MDIHISMFLTRVIGGLPGMQEGHFATTRRVVLQLRGERFYNHAEEKFAISRGSKIHWISGVSRVGGIASSRILNYQVF